jgi:hypothetical protein
MIETSGMSSLLVLISQGLSADDAGGEDEEERAWSIETTAQVEAGKRMGYGVEPVNEFP